MENYLVGRETLGKFVDQLIAQKYPNEPQGSLEDLREESIKKLDNQISDAVFNSLSDDELNELNSMFDRGENDPLTFMVFFKKAGIDTERIIEGVIVKFSQDFLGGENA